MVYEFFLRFIVSAEVKAKAAKKSIDQVFCAKVSLRPAGVDSGLEGWWWWCWWWGFVVGVSHDGSKRSNVVSRVVVGVSLDG